MTAAQLRILRALTVVYTTHGRATVSAVAAVAGRNLSTTAKHLRALRQMGLVAYEGPGTLRVGEVS